MKRYLFVCLLLLSVHLCFAQDEAAMLKVLATRQAAWNRGDIEGFMQGYWKSESLVFVDKTAVVNGWQTTLDHYKASYPDKATMGYLAFYIMKAEVMDKTNAVVLGNWRLTRDMAKGSLAGYFTVWLKSIGGVWVIVYEHTS